MSYEYFLIKNVLEILFQESTHIFSLYILHISFIDIICACANVCFDAGHTACPNAFIGEVEHCFLLALAGIPFQASPRPRCYWWPFLKQLLPVTPHLTMWLCLQVKRSHFKATWADFTVGRLQ